MYPGFQKYFALAALVLLGSGILLGGTSNKSIVAFRTKEAPRIDGLLSEEAWQATVPTEGFQQFNPDEGSPSTERTVISVLYDDDALYIGAHCYDSDPSGIVSLMSRRDRSLQADKLTVWIDSYHDHSIAFLFSGAVSGVQTDGILSQDGRVYDVEWDAVWDFSASATADGWTAEFRIPFSALRFAAQDSEYIWGINFRRFIPRKQEVDEWVLVRRNEAPPGTISSVSKMGHLTGLRDIHPSMHLELMPYQSSKETFLSQPLPFSLRSKFTGTGGLDLKYGVTNNFTFDLAVNPDFGQVEVDQSVLNLTVFETFYPEKRPLFLEGSQFFSFGNSFDSRELRLFYSRRIGRKPSAPLADPGYTIVESPQTAKILGAGKLTGKTEDGLAVGAFSAVTDREYGLEENLSGNAKEIAFTSRSSYNVLRLKKDVLENSSIGMMATGAFNEDGAPHVSEGADWNLRFSEGRYAVDGYFAGSHYSSLAGDHRSGAAGKIAIAKLEGEHLLAFTSYDFSSRDFSLDELGFFSESHEHGGYVQLTYKEDQASDPFLRYTVTAETDYRWDLDGAKTVSRAELQPYWEFRNFWTLNLDWIHEFPAYDDIERGILGLYRRAEGNRFYATLTTDASKPLALTLFSGYINSTKGLSTVFNTLEATVRPNSWIELSPSVTLYHSRNEEAWVIPLYTDDGRNLFGDRDIDEYDFSLRGIMTFSRRVSFQFFTQVFLAKGQYSNFKKMAGPDDLPSYDFLNSPSYVNPDFNDKTINANLVFRWEYLPGSTFYLVWTQYRNGATSYYDKTLSENFSDAFRLPMDNAILAKISYWWSF
ncbi:MAG TPA: DUF5916 domain-containing protein [Bacteroidota bacterium]|nr:DUF5916 domain-containing protein [Bacteroidota bacterium]